MNVSTQLQRAQWTLPRYAATCLRIKCSPSHKFYLRKERRPWKVLKSARGSLKTLRAASSDATAANIRKWFHTLDSGLKLEVLSSEVPTTSKPTIIFIHGAGHGAWCWQEHFMPWFSGNGYTSHAISLRGQAGSDVPVGAKAGGTLTEHADDISHFVRARLQERPILVGHSFGGLVVQSYVLKDYESRAAVLGVGLLASAPPQGNQQMIGRFLKNTPWKAVRVTWAFVTKSYLKDPSAAKFLFFSEDLPQVVLNRYAALLRENQSPLPVVDVSALKQQVPLPAATPQTPPVCVLCGNQDNSVDQEGAYETAEAFSVTPIFLKDTAHDVMLDTRWMKAAECLEEWCSTLV